MTTLYEQDFALWSEQMADLIANRQFDQLDIENLVEEIRDLSKRERDRLFSSLRLILHHLLKWDHQPELRSRSWLVTQGKRKKNIKKMCYVSAALRQGQKAYSQDSSPRALPFA
jgi:hypothetical protein